MSAYLGKYHLAINSVGYVLAHNTKGEKYYQKKVAPTFVSKFGGGDSAYRDATFWQYFTQTNWRNGSKQQKWDDPGKFWKSANVDTSQLEQLTLSKSLVSVGQLASGIKVNAMESLRTSATSAFGDGGDSTYSSVGNATDAPIDSACTGTSGTTSLTATNTSFAANQKILIHQSRGTGAGNYEINEISAYTAGTITTKTALSNTYASGAQVLVMKEYTTFVQNAGHTLTSKTYNGTVGGIIAFYASTSATITGVLNASGYGYRGGNGIAGATGYCGEGTAGAVVAYQETANGNGGGAGRREVSAGSWDAGGGGGGGNAAAGTDGGGSGGSPGALAGNAGLTNMVFGGGGGGGGGEWSGSAPGGNGGNGGGIVFIIAKSVTITGSITSAGVNGSNDDHGGGGGGAGGSVLIKAQTAVLGTNLINVAAGSGGTGGGYGYDGGAGAVGRIHLSYSSTYSGTTSPTLDVSTDTSLSDIPASTTATLYAGGSDGKVYYYTSPSTWTESFDTRKLTWYDSVSLYDSNPSVGDDGGTEYAQAQGFQLATAQTVKAVQVYLAKSEGTPGDVTVRIETDSAGVPSGSLANANATGTITAFTQESPTTWYTCTFATAFSLSATTQYHLVLKTAAAANDNRYVWGADGSSPSYSSGAMSSSSDGGSSWSAVAGSDAFFRILSNPTEVYCMKTSSLASGGANVMYVGVGDVNSVTNGDARLYSYNGTTWALTKTFTDSIASSVLSIEESTENTKVYLGVGPQARMYETADFATFTLSKRITVPQNPGYPYAIKEYNTYIYTGGGSPEQIPTGYYQGFVQYYDTVKWRKLYDYDFTVMKSMEFYDSYLFMGSYHGHLHVYNSASLDPLFNFKDDYNYSVQVYSMKYFDDKLYVGLYPQEGSGETNTGVWKFDRRGLSNAHSVSGVTGYRCFAVSGGILYIGTGDNGYVYKLSDTNYETQGWYQSSYFDANLPSIPKLFNAVTIRHDPLESGESIVVYYKFKESDDWTTLGTSDTDDAVETTLTFPSGTSDNKITLKCELNCTTTTHSPKLTEVIMQYSLYPDKKWQWTMRLYAKDNLMLLDKSEETRTATQIRAALEALMDTETLYAYVDVDGTSYNVLVTDIDQNSWVVNQDTVQETEIVLTLLEA
jgi:hypothetical protein